MKRKSLVAGSRPQQPSPAEAHAALEALEQRRSPTSTSRVPAPTAAGSTTTTAIHLPRETLHLLRRVAAERANRHGGRPSVSAVLVSLVEASRDELEAEISR